MKIKKPIGIIFDSGAFTAGACEVGYAKAVFDKNLWPYITYIQGVSVGSLNKSVLAEQDGDPSDMESVWTEVIEHNKKGSSFIFDFSPQKIVKRLRKPWIASNSGIKALCRMMDWEKIVNSDKKLDVVVYDLENRCRKIVSNHDQVIQDNPDLFRKYVLASASIRGIFRPVSIEGHHYSDGCLFSIDAALKSGCKTIFLFLNMKPEYGETWNDIWLKQLLEGNRENSWEAKKEIISAYKLILKERLVIFQVKEPVPNLTSTNFKKPKSKDDQGPISQAIEMAYQEGIRVLDNI